MNPPCFALTSGASATEVILISIVVALSSIAYIVWLVKR